MVPEPLHPYVDPPKPLMIQTGNASRCDGCDQERCAELNLPESLGLYTARASVAEQRHLGWAAVTSTTASGAAVVASGAASAAGRSDGPGTSTGMGGDSFVGLAAGTSRASAGQRVLGRGCCIRAPRWASRTLRALWNSCLKASCLAVPSRQV
jgi:hypothetical protein